MVNNITIEEAIISLNSEASMNINGVDLDTCTITWTNDTPEISKADIQTEMDRLQSEYEAKEYQRKRKAEYPVIYDYIDGVVKDDQEQINKYIADCQAVKDKYPKG